MWTGQHTRITLSVCFALLGAAGPQAIAQDTSPAWVPTSDGVFYFAVQVTDVDRAVAWYTMVFGLTEQGGASADDDRWEIMNLRNDYLLVEIIRDSRAQPAERAHGFFKVGFQVPDLDAVADRAAQAQGERPRIIDFEQTGIRLLQLSDPEGNTLQLFASLPEHD